MTLSRECDSRDIRGTVTFPNSGRLGLIFYVSMTLAPVPPFPGLHILDGKLLSRRQMSRHLSDTFNIPITVYTGDTLGTMRHLLLGRLRALPLDL